MIQLSLLATRDMQATIVKQLLGEQDDTNLDKHRYIDRLVEIADLESAEHQSLIDPFDRSVALVFQMVNDASLDPWDVDVIAVIDGFLDQLRQRIEVPQKVAAQLKLQGGSYEKDLAESSEAFLAASVLVGLKAEILESHMR